MQRSIILSKSLSSPKNIAVSRFIDLIKSVFVISSLGKKKRPKCSIVAVEPSLIPSILLTFNFN